MKKISGRRLHSHHGWPQHESSNTGIMDIKRPIILQEKLNLQISYKLVFKALMATYYPVKIENSEMWYRTMGQHLHNQR